MNYWHECIAEAFSEAEIAATDDQIATVATWVEGAHDNYSMAHGHDVIGNPMVRENERLVRELDVERNKRVCPECRGARTITNHGPHHSATSRCDRCRGEGKVI